MSNAVLRYKLTNTLKHKPSGKVYVNNSGRSFNIFIKSGGLFGKPSLAYIAPKMGGGYEIRYVSRTNSRLRNKATQRRNSAANALRMERSNRAIAESKHRETYQTYN
jgi:hypothetical protein